MGNIEDVEEIYGTEVFETENDINNRESVEYSRRGLS